jgi:hypothetical protein
VRGEAVKCINCGKPVPDSHRFYELKSSPFMPVFFPWCNEKCWDAWAEKIVAKEKAGLEGGSPLLKQG